MTSESGIVITRAIELRMMNALRAHGAFRIIKALGSTVDNEDLEYQLLAAWVIIRDPNRISPRVVDAAQRALERAEHSTDPTEPAPGFTQELEEDAGRQLIQHLELLASRT